MEDINLKNKIKQDFKGSIFKIVDCYYPECDSPNCLKIYIKNLGGDFEDKRIARVSLIESDFGNCLKLEGVCLGSILKSVQNKEDKKELFLNEVKRLIEYF